uniref:RNA-directed RNA polymerase catalytic subunit n=1 Tax=Coleopteran orthomyxo-related virus OKIAV179 TaxID=2746263 RepID=A0A7D7EZ69_9ORTO|nr:polymerase PB1 [Coleopteran orthomyxo-related virus OKIAV179]
MWRETKFEQLANSLLVETLMPNDLTATEKRDYNITRLIDPKITDNLSTVSMLYIYTGTPPMGYGTQAPKVAETVNRSYEFNRKTKNKTFYDFDGFPIERLNWVSSDGPFPHNEIHGNFSVKHVSEMTKKFLVKYHKQIDRIVDKTMKNMIETNSDILTKGRQTFDPFFRRSVTSAIAYKRFHEMLKLNTGAKSFSCLEWIQAIMKVFESDRVKATVPTFEIVDGKVFEHHTNQWVEVEKRVPVVKVEEFDEEESKPITLEWVTSFGTYLKHKERGKKDRRAICSANMGLRMFLHIVEYFHLELAKEIEGSTISIGGEEKKAKIITNLSDIRLEGSTPSVVVQGTEDASKWNECLAPACFATMHYFMFNDDVRSQLLLPRSSEMGKLFSKIACALHYLQSRKIVQLGPGPIIRNEEFYRRIEWDRTETYEMNDATAEWYKKIRDRLDPCGFYAQASPGMLMGMLNAASTTLGLLAVNYRTNESKFRTVTMRSSDDSMSLYMANSTKRVKQCIETNRTNLSFIGINLSKEKTIFCREGVGEYTSWHMDGSFVAQFGVETASLRPQGKNPYDDLYSAAKSTSVALSTLTINPLGASARLRLAIDGVKRLWRVKYEPEKRHNVSPNVLLIEDGGENIWNCMNSHLEEISIKERLVSTPEEKLYLDRITNPENPFISDVKEEMQFSKEHGMLVLDTVETPRNVFTYVKRSNRTLAKKSKAQQEKEEKANGEVISIVNRVDPSTLLSYPISNTTISQHLISIISARAEAMNLTDEEIDLVNQAMSKLQKGDTIMSDDDSNVGLGFFEYDSE